MRTMYAAVLVLLAVAASDARVHQHPISVIAPEPKKDIDDAIIKALESLRELMSEGIPALGVPVLEPLTVPHYDVNVDAELAKISASLDDLMIKNLSTFKIVNIANDMENLKADFDLYFDRISFSGLYNMTGQALGSVNIFGDGPFTQVVEGFDVGGTVHLASKSGDKNSTAELDKMQVRFSVKGFKTNFTNIMGGGEMGDMVNNLISESAPDFIKDNQVELSTLIGDTVKGLVNPILGHFTLKEILDFLGVPN